MKSGLYVEKLNKRIAELERQLAVCKANWDELEKCVTRDVKKVERLEVALEDANNIKDEAMRKAVESMDIRDGAIKEVERLKAKLWQEKCQVADHQIQVSELRKGLEKIRWLLADKAERIPMTNLGRDIDKIAEKALKKANETRTT